jgi:catechol 2,3-dioxygenase-like lactoylglutathione lyase family enzyme
MEVKDFLHTGISVRNLKESVKFYTEVMGMEEHIKAAHKGPRISQVVNVKDADIEVCYVKKRNHLLELFEYKGKDEAKQNGKCTPQDNPGLVHIAFLVDDVDQMYEKIKDLGYEFYSPPMVTRENGPKITFFKGPDNVIIELYEKVS